MQTDTSTRQSHSLIASDRVEGTPVRRSDGGKIGTIERLMIDKLSGNVAYAVLSFGGFLGMGQKHLPIPWARLTYDRALGAYHLDLTEEELKRAVVCRRGGLRLGRPQSRNRDPQLLPRAAVLGRLLDRLRANAMPRS
jgi:PRC-barrel domain